MTSLSGFFRSTTIQTASYEPILIGSNSVGLCHATIRTFSRCSLLEDESCRFVRHDECLPAPQCPRLLILESHSVAHNDVRDDKLHHYACMESPRTTRMSLLASCSPHRCTSRRNSPRKRSISPHRELLRDFSKLRTSEWRLGINESPRLEVIG